MSTSGSAVARWAREALRLRWLFLANLYLIAPPLVYDVVLSFRQTGRIDKVAFFVVPASALGLLAVQASARRLWLVHGLLWPFYVLVGCDLFLIARYDCRLSSSSISVMLANADDGWAYVRVQPAIIVTAVCLALVFHLLCVRGLRRIPPLASRRVAAASLLGVAALYGALLGARTREHGTLAAGVTDTLTHDRTSPFGVLAQGYLAISVVRDGREHAQRSATFRFGAERVEAPVEREVYVLVIGESSRPDHWGLYGYHRDTTPRLGSRGDLIVFQDVVAQVALTQFAVPQLITRQTLESPDRDAHETSVLSLFREAGFTTYWISTQQRDPWVGAVNRYSTEADHTRFLERRHDGVLVESLARVLAEETSRKLFVVLHTTGSHFIFGDRYPQEFERFPAQGPALTERARMVNAYDNSILYTDHVLDEILELLSARPGLSALLYASDHGENLRDDGRDLVGHFLNNEYDLPIPMVLWGSSAYAARWPEKLAAARGNAGRRLSSRVVFGTLADLAGIQLAGGTPVSPWSALRADLREQKRLVFRRWEAVDYDREVRRADRGAQEATW
jgi:heptose-I-phosphate ethanolaminephosphotransferase